VRALNVQLDRPGAVEITYRASGETDSLVLVSDVVSSAHDLLLTRLHADEHYIYVARGITSTGTRGSPVTGEFTTGELPAGLVDISFSATGVPTRPLALLQISSASNGWFGVVAVDAAGRVVWYHRTKTAAMGFLRRSDGTVAIIDNGIIVVGATGDTVASLAGESESYGNIHHALANTSAGGILFVATDVRTIRDTAVTGDAIWEWNPATGSVTKRWTAFDFMDWTQERTPAGGATDWLHANAVSVGSHGNIIMGFRNLNQVISIAPDWHSLEWRLGGPGSTITLSESDAFWGQHGAREISPGHILMFDNGFSRVVGGDYSRALELVVDLESKTARKVWEYRATPDMTSIRLGSVQRYANGNTLIDFGWKTPSPIQILEVTSTGTVQWKLLPNGIPSKIYAVEPVETLFGESSSATTTNR
jgi:hypothetical protein